MRTIIAAAFTFVVSYLLTCCLLGCGPAPSEPGVTYDPLAHRATETGLDASPGGWVDSGTLEGPYCANGTCACDASEGRECPTWADAGNLPAHSGFQAPRVE